MNEDDSSDDDYEDSDSNAEDYYQNDYPEDELSEDDLACKSRWTVNVFLSSDTTSSHLYASTILHKSH